MTLFRSLGFLRLALITLAIINILLRPAPGTIATHEGLDIFSTLIAPAVAPILLMVLLFDALMSKVRAGDESGEERIKFMRIMLIEIATVIILVIAWFPYFIALGR